MRIDIGYEETLERITSKLGNLGCGYALTGGYLTTIYGDPRSTQNIDIITSITSAELPRFISAVESEFLISPEVAEDAIRRGALFQVLDLKTSIKTDLHVVGPSNEEIGRARDVTTLGGATVRALCKEDAIASKLRWVKKGSHRSRRDIKGMLLNKSPFDREKVVALAEKSGCLQLFLEIEAEPPVAEIE